MPNHGEAFRFLEANAERMFGHVPSMLYVGHRGDTHPWWRTTFRDLIGAPDLAVIDIVKGNLDTAAEFTNNLVCGDIRGNYARGFGLVFWDEGPEHVPREDALETLARLAEHNSHVLVSCPWGYMPQGSGPSDPEFHHWGPQPADFRGIGFMAEVFGVEFNGLGQGHGNLIAWI